jgi:hypothetical protein
MHLRLNSKSKLTQIGGTRNKLDSFKHFLSWFTYKSVAFVYCTVDTYLELRRYLARF